MDDMGRLRERVLNLQKHFGQANQDIEQILISAEKVAKRGNKIEALEFDEADSSRDARTVIPAPIRKLQAGE
jgi:DNA recombination protein RmuC